MKKLKLRDDQCIHYQHRIPIYGVQLHVLRANDFAPAWDILFADLPVAGDPRAYGCHWFDAATNTAYVGLQTGANAATIAHEALHLTHAILHNIGHKADYRNDEPACYLLGYLVLQLTPGKGEKKINYPKP